MDMGAEEQHLATPKLRAIDEFGVALGVGNTLVSGVGEGVRTSAREVHAKCGCDGTQEIKALIEICDRIPHAGLFARDQLDRIAQHLPVDQGVIGIASRNLTEDGFRTLA